MTNENEAFEKKDFPSLSNFKQICWKKNNSFAWAFVNAILTFCLKTAGLCFHMSFN